MTNQKIEKFLNGDQQQLKFDISGMTTRKYKVTKGWGLSLALKQWHPIAQEWCEISIFTPAEFLQWLACQRVAETE